MEKIVTPGDIRTGLKEGASKRDLYQQLGNMVQRIREGRGKNGSEIVTELGEKGFREIAEEIRRRTAGNNRG